MFPWHRDAVPPLLMEPSPLTARSSPPRELMEAHALGDAGREQAAGYVCCAVFYRGGLGVTSEQMSASHRQFGHKPEEEG